MGRGRTTWDEEYSASEEDDCDDEYGEDDNTSDDDLVEPRERASSTRRHSRSRPSTVSRKRPKKQEEEEDDDNSLPKEVDRQWQPDVDQEMDVLCTACTEFAADTRCSEVIEALVEPVDEAKRARARSELNSIVNGPVAREAVQKALDVVNTENKTLHQRNGGDRLHAQLQQHGGDSGSRQAVLGSYPVTTVLANGVEGADQTLASDSNSTNFVINTLYGVGRRARERAVVANQLPTTVKGEYTAVPRESDYQLFDPSFRRFIKALNKAGVRILSCIAPSTAAVVLSELAAATGTTIIQLRQHADFKLLLVIPPDRPSFLLEMPFEHRSHLTWGALKYSNRLLLAAGCATTAAPLRALLSLHPLQPGAVLALVGPQEKTGDGRASGWYSSGAYCEAVMRQKLFAFTAAYGDEDGRRRWTEWYTGCKSRAGATNKLGTDGRWTNDKKADGGDRQTEQSRAIEDAKARGIKASFKHTFTDGTSATLSTETGTQHTGGAAPRVGHSEVNDKKDGVTLIRESDGGEVPCRGASINPGNGGSTLLSLTSRDFVLLFGLPGSNTTFCQLIARRLAKPIVRVVKDGIIEYWELPKGHFERYETKTGQPRLRVTVDRSIALTRVDLARWQAMSQGADEEEEEEEEEEDM